MIKKIDKKNKFISIFNPDTGFYVRSGVIENGKFIGGVLRKPTLAIGYWDNGALCSWRDRTVY